MNKPLMTNEMRNQKLFAAFEMQEGNSRIFDFRIGNKVIRAFSIVWWIVCGGIMAAGYVWCLGCCAALMCL